MRENIVYPISEIFVSPQGEGLWTGTLMTFIRTAGCCVGKPYPGEGKLNDSQKIVTIQPPAVRAATHKVLPIYTEMCTLYDGRTFECDTDYRVKERLTPAEILGRVAIDVPHVCITGGEPFIHDLFPLVDLLERHGKKIHIETSGARKHNGWEIMLPERPWITVSPKQGCLPEMVKRANEIKLLIDEKFDFGRLYSCMVEHPMVWIQPVNYENEINTENMDRCIALQKKYPNWRISSQAHKLWKVR